MDIIGSDLIDPFSYNVSWSFSGSGITFNSDQIYEPGSISVNYSIAGNATKGTQNLTLSNRFGTSNSVPFTVYDPSPTITGVNPSIWPAGVTNYPATINGYYFGTNPSVTTDDPHVHIAFGSNPSGFNGLLNGQINTSPQSINVAVTVDASDPGGPHTLTVTSNGYGYGFAQAPPGGTLAANNVIQITPYQPPAATIQYFGGSIPATVYAGQLISVTTNASSISALAPATYTWTIDGAAQGTAIASYTANTTAGTITQLPALNNAGVAFYWTAPGAHSVTFSYCDSLMVCSPTSTANFNVAGPTNVTVATSVSIVGIVNPPNSFPVNTGWRDVPLLEDGTGLGPGMQFAATATLPQNNQGQYQWTQLMNSDFDQYLTPQGPGPHTNSIIPANVPQLDTTYPYGSQPYCQPGTTVYTTFAPCDTAEDSPVSPLLVQQGEFSRSFNATMYLEWVPTPDNSCTTSNQSGSPCAIEAPLGSITWHWGGDAIDTMVQKFDINGISYQQWVVNTNQVNNTCPSPNCAVPQPFRAGGSLPTWQNTVNKQ